jgi:hypothetical protein
LAWRADAQRLNHELDNRTFATVKVCLLCLLTLLAGALLASEAILNIEHRGGDVVLFVTGGTSNVQYQVFTSPDNAVESTNWYYWRRAYSMDFKPYGEMLVYGTNTSQQPRRFFQIRGVLPD